MSNTTRTILGLLTVALLLCWALPATTFADEALDKSFEALKIAVFKRSQRWKPHKVRSLCHLN